jgi:hypothetical protein
MMLSPVDARRRWFGLLFLLLAGGMLLWGQTWLEAHLQGMVFVAYWLGCFVFTGLAMITALLDARAVRRQAQREQRALAQRALGPMASPSPCAEASRDSAASDHASSREAWHAGVPAKPNRETTALDHETQARW